MKAKILTQLVLGIIFCNVTLCYSQNILTDGDFSATTVITPYTPGAGPVNEWCYLHVAETDAIASVVSGECYYQITYGGYNLSDVQLVQSGFQLTPGDYYRLTFDVKSDADRWFGVYLGEDGGLWTDLLGWDNYYQNVSTSWQTKTMDFSSSDLFDYLKLSFEVGGFTGNIFFDNITLIDLGPYPSIGVLGSALTGWDADVDMSTADGEVYTLSDYPLTLGALKFRQNNTWSINWGGTTFPTGTGTFFGPDIPVISASNYDITFNRITGEYSFVCVSNCHAGIGISGTAVPPDYNWDTDVNMSTSDGVIYKLQSYAFSDGEAKFRQDDSWDISWGAVAFPSGTATLGGPAIPVTAGSYNVTFNITTGEFSFSYPEIGILGSALTGWSEDIDLQTTDGTIYTLTGYDFTGGEVKFRQDNDWLLNWGDYTFPTGYGYQGGPNIPVTAGNYNVTFNRVTGEYTFTATNCPVAGIKCPDYIYISTSPGICEAEVFYPDVVPAANCGGEGLIITQTAGLPSGSFFPVGVTTNTFVLTNASGNTATCSFDVIVSDREAPFIKNLSADPESIWPPNHKMVPVTINYTAYDNCGGPVSNQLWVESNEPDNGHGDGNTIQDWEISDEHHLLLRAERSGKGQGREYYIYIMSHDESWNYNYQQVIVKVAHDMGKPGFIIPDPDTTGEAMPVMVNIWPNPSTQYFNLDIGSISDESIVLYISDANGRRVSTISNVNRYSSHFGDELKPGVYFVTVRQGGRSTTIKVVKQ